jgi:hypothetical protein
MSALSGGARILMTGPPRNAKAVVRPAAAERVVAVRIDLYGRPSILRAHVRPFGSGASEIRLRLPRETAPGEYRGETTIAGAKHEVVVRVAPAPRTRVEPKFTYVTAEPGGRADFDIVVSNRGNVPVEVPKSTELDLDSEVDQDRSLGRSLRAELHEGEKRVDRFFEELRRGHGGVANLTVLNGAGAIEPGDSRSLRCRIEIPMTTEAGRDYVAVWQFADAGHAIQVDVAKAATGGNGRQVR